MKYRLGIITPIWKRPKLTKLFLDYYEGIGTYRRQAVLSDDEWLAYNDNAGWYGTKYFNEPLADKHNAGTLALRNTDVDAVCLIPSDDFFTPGYFAAVERALDADYDAVQVESLYFYCLQTRRLLRGERLGTGAGFVLRRDVLERLGWQPWPAGANNSMDANMFAHCKNQIKNRYKIATPENLGFVGVDVKGRTTRNAFGKLWGDPETLCAGLSYKERIDDPARVEAFWRGHFPEMADQMLYNNEELAE